MNNTMVATIKRRNARKKSAQRARSYGLCISDLDWLDCLTFFNNGCAYCDSVENLQADRIIPGSHGGLYTKHNVVPSCKRCNMKKSNNNMSEWYRQQPFFDKNKLDRIFTWSSMD